MRNMRAKCVALLDEYADRAYRTSVSARLAEPAISVPAPRLTDAMKDTAIRLRSQGINVHDIATLVGLSVYEVTDILDAAVGGVPIVTDHEAMTAHVDSVLGETAAPSRRRGGR